VFDHSPNPPDLDVTASLGKLLRAEFTEDSARAVRHAMDLTIRTRGGYSEFTLPELLDYELVVLNDF